MAKLVSLSIFFPGIYFLRPSVLVLAWFILLKHNSSSKVLDLKKSCNLGM